MLSCDLWHSLGIFKNLHRFKSQFAFDFNSLNISRLHRTVTTLVCLSWAMFEDLDLRDPLLCAFRLGL